MPVALPPSAVGSCLIGIMSGDTDSLTLISLARPPQLFTIIGKHVESARFLARFVVTFEANKKYTVTVHVLYRLNA